MKQRILGKSGLHVSEIGLGCWQLGGDFGPVDDDRARQVLAAADAAGIDFWDTADVYGGGVSEQRIAAYRAARGPDVIVATKVGRGGALFPDGYSRAAVREHIEGSAQRLGVDTLDLVQLHCVPPEVLADGEIMTWLEDFQSEGLLRHFGASVQTLDEARLAMRHPKLTSLQIIFNLLRQDAISALFPAAAEQQVGIIVRLPLASGILAGKMSLETRFAESDHRHYNRHGEAFSQGETFSGIPFETALELIEPIREMLPNGLSMAQLAMRWILDQPAVSTVITGATRSGQVTENASVSELPPLSPTLHERLAAYYRDHVRSRICVPI
jgi:aryl-alcohol dehydrogenase-like predicted oxidoreductase